MHKTYLCAILRADHVDVILFIIDRVDKEFLEAKVTCQFFLLERKSGRLEMPCLIPRIAGAMLNVDSLAADSCLPA